MICQRWGCKQVNHPPAGEVVNNLHVPSKYHSGTTPRPIPQAYVLSSLPPGAVNGNISTATGEIKQMLHDMKSEIRSDMQSLTTGTEKLEVSPSFKLPPSSGFSSISPPSIIPSSPQVSLFKDDAPKHVSLPPVKVPDPPGSALLPNDLPSLHSLNITRFKFVKLQ